MSHVSFNLRGRLFALLGLGVAVLAGGAGEAVAHESLDHYVFVPNRDSADVAVIDTRVDRVVARVPVGTVPHQVVVAASLGKLVASNTADNTISVVDLETYATEATIALDSEPEHMALAPGGALLAVGNLGAGTVSLVSLVQNRETARVAGLFAPHNMTFGPRGQRLYVANLGAGHVSVIDVARAEIVDESPVTAPVSMAAADAAAQGDYQGVVNVTATLDGRLGFAAHGDSNSLTVIDLERGRAVKSLTVGARPWRAYASPDGQFMLVPNNGDATVSVISTKGLDIVATLPGAEDMTGVNFSPDGRTAYVIGRGADTAVILDLAAMAPVGEIALPGRPETGVVMPDSGKLYVALSGAGTVAVIDTGARKLLGTIAGVGAAPWGASAAVPGGYCH